MLTIVNYSAHVDGKNYSGRYVYSDCPTSVPDPENYRKDISADTNIQEKDIRILSVRREDFYTGQTVSAQDYKNAMIRCVMVMNECADGYPEEYSDARNALRIWLSIHDEFGVTREGAEEAVLAYLSGCRIKHYIPFLNRR